MAKASEKYEVMYIINPNFTEFESGHRHHVRRKLLRFASPVSVRAGKAPHPRVCPDDCNIPLAGGVEDLTGGFCYGKDQNECNFYVYSWCCSICGAEPDFTANREE